MQKTMQTKAEISARHPPPRSGLVQLLSELLATAAVYPVMLSERITESTAISAPNHISWGSISIFYAYVWAGAVNSICSLRLLQFQTD
jgi:hypothetical protein